MCCSNDPELCDMEGPIPGVDQTCDYLKDQLASNGIEGCPSPMIYEGCPKMCGKCDCCATDLTKCDIGADENTSCQVAYDLSNGAACGAIGDRCPKTCGLCRTIEYFPTHDKCVSLPIVSRVKSKREIFI